jgi:TolA-binding protein
MVDREELKRLAEAAKEANNSCWYSARDLRHTVDDALFIAAMSPVVVLALLAELEAAEQDVEGWQRSHDQAMTTVEQLKAERDGDFEAVYRQREDWRKRATQAEAERDQLRGEVERLRQDFENSQKMSRFKGRELIKRDIERDQLRAERERLRAALRFYARSWSTPQPRLPTAARPSPTVALAADAGEYARRALGEEDA